jgi:hypothetical protein
MLISVRKLPRRGASQTESPASPVSSPDEQFARDISLNKMFYDSIADSHQRNFVKVTYTNLRDNNTVHLDDFSSAIDSCQQFYLDVCIHVLSTEY